MLNRLFPKLIKPTAITFHNIPDEAVSWFTETIVHLEKNFGFMNPSEFNNISCRGKILLTFDDGFKSNKNVADNVLNALKIKAIFFITSNFIGLKDQEAFKFAQQNFFPSRPIKSSDGNIKAMDWDDVKDLKSNGHTIGAHTLNHSNLKSLPLRNQKNSEIIESSNIIEKVIGSSIKHFAYPFGNHEFIDKVDVEIVKENFSYAFTNVRGNIHDNNCKHLIFRQNIKNYTRKLSLLAILLGAYDIKHRSNRKKIKDLI